jgi:hypothetical protein
LGSGHTENWNESFKSFYRGQ